MRVQIEVKGISSTLTLPTRIERARRGFKASVGEGLVVEIGRNIHSRSGRLSASWRAIHVSATGGIALRSQGTEYAKASVGGAYIVRKRGRALALADGRFFRFVRLTPGHYIGRPTDRRTSYITRAFDHFREITRAAWLLHFGEEMRR